MRFVIEIISPENVFKELSDHCLDSEIFMLFKIGSKMSLAMSLLLLELKLKFHFL